MKKFRMYFLRTKIMLGAKATSQDLLPNTTTQIPCKNFQRNNWKIMLRIVLWSKGSRYSFLECQRSTGNMNWKSNISFKMRCLISWRYKIYMPALFKYVAFAEETRVLLTAHYLSLISWPYEISWLRCKSQIISPFTKTNKVQMISSWTCSGKKISAMICRPLFPKTQRNEQSLIPGKMNTRKRSNNLLTWE